MAKPNEPGAGAGSAPGREYNKFTITHPTDPSSPRVVTQQEWTDEQLAIAGLEEIRRAVHSSRTSEPARAFESDRIGRRPPRRRQSAWRRSKVTGMSTSRSMRRVLARGVDLEVWHDGRGTSYVRIVARPTTSPGTTVLVCHDTRRHKKDLDARGSAHMRPGRHDELCGRSGLEGSDRDQAERDRLMGYGDEIMAAGHAQTVYDRDPRSGRDL